MSNFGERLKFFRQHILKMSRKEFCEKYEIPSISVQSWENSGVRISRNQKEKLEKKLCEEIKDFDLNWLFLGDGTPWDILKKNTSSPSDSIYKIDNFFYEPLLKKNTILKINPTSLNLQEIECPHFILLKNPSGHVHFGILTLTMDKKYIMEAFQGNFYRIIPSDSDQVYVVHQIIIKHD